MQFSSGYNWYISLTDLFMSIDLCIHPLEIIEKLGRNYKRGFTVRFLELMHFLLFLKLPFLARTMVQK